MFEKVRQILASEIEIAEQEITLESDLFQDLGVESMDLYCIMERLEEEFNIKISESSDIKTVKDIVETVISPQKADQL
jgi:acyl carrier protein